jgi:hypothetical protein
MNYIVFNIAVFLNHHVPKMMIFLPIFFSL